ncbi:hypothetical protein KDL01_08470 [Actinospica durhamensis]|uniref:Uncharacterized protein n=1 Tax=Actinospica durhamensis TaxID=1508375 RepID=A0A941EKK3_9ACTN|nr:hypothetical protein [Actinospica durhamensis]MBR7833297.1 hypothetical protein [Actinospica durhamensis]
MPWRNATIPAFLTAFADLIRSSHYCADFEEGFGPPPMNGWRDLAALLHAARGAVVRGELPTPEPISDHRGVEDAETLRGYIQWLTGDFQNDQADLAMRAAEEPRAREGGWAHAVIENWLATWSYWLRDWYLTCLKAASPELKAEQAARLEPVTWTSIAIQLSAARIYSSRADV